MGFVRSYPVRYSFAAIAVSTPQQTCLTIVPLDFHSVSNQFTFGIHVPATKPLSLIAQAPQPSGPSSGIAGTAGGRSVVPPLCHQMYARWDVSLMMPPAT